MSQHMLDVQGIIVEEEDQSQGLRVSKCGYGLKFMWVQFDLHGCDEVHDEWWSSPWMAW